MRHRLKNQKGFTLLEIIVVMIIVGVLAAIALPNLFGQIERNRAQEGMSTAGAVKNAIEACMQTGVPFANCDTAAEIGVAIPGSSLFTYGIAGGGSFTTSADTLVFTITARRNTLNGGATGDSLTLSRAAGGTYTKGVGGTTYAGVW